jgi:N utilization substance protein B
MPVPIQKFREIVFQMLYSYDIGGPTEEDVQDLLMKELAVTRKTVKQAQEKVDDIRQKLKEIDKIILKTCVSYEFDRIQTVEKNILRLSIFEMLHDTGIPPKVAISEGMRLARKFGSPESAGFINAVLDNIYKASKGEAVDHKEIEQSGQKLLEIEEISKEASTQEKPKPDEDDE